MRLLSKIKYGVQLIGETFGKLFCAFMSKGIGEKLDISSTVFNMELEEMVTISDQISINYNTILDLIHDGNKSTEVAPFIKDMLLDLHTAANILRLAYLEKGRFNIIRGGETLIFIMENIENYLEDRSILRHNQSVDFSLANFHNLLKSLNRRTQHI